MADCPFRWWSQPSLHRLVETRSTVRRLDYSHISPILVHPFLPSSSLSLDISFSGWELKLENAFLPTLVGGSVFPASSRRNTENREKCCSQPEAGEKTRIILLRPDIFVYGLYLLSMVKMYFWIRWPQLSRATMNYNSNNEFWEFCFLSFFDKKKNARNSLTASLDMFLSREQEDRLEDYIFEIMAEFAEYDILTRGRFDAFELRIEHYLYWVLHIFPLGWL